MHITVGQIIVWLIVGALAGSLTGIIVKRTKKGFGLYYNLAVGLVGALLGGLLFKVFNIDLGLGDISITFEDLLAAFIGSFLFLAIVWGVRKYRKKEPQQD